HAPGLTGANLSQFAPGMTQTKGGLTRVYADAEQLVLENGFYFAEIGGEISFHAKPGLADAGKEHSVPAKLIGEGRQLAGPHHVKPGRIDIAEVVAHVQHGVAVDLQALVFFFVSGAPAALWRSSGCGACGDRNLCRWRAGRLFRLRRLR